MHQPSGTPDWRDFYAGAPQPGHSAVPGRFGASSSSPGATLPHLQSGSQQFPQSPAPQSWGQPQWGANAPNASLAVRLKPVRGLGTATIVLGCALTGAHVLQALTSFSAARQYSEALTTWGSTAQVHTAYDAVSALTALLGLATFVVACLWLHRARGNSEVIHPAQRHDRSRFWLWVGWFVPIACLVYPYRVVRDVAHGSDSSRRLSGLPSLDLWWGLWVAGLVTSRIADRTFPWSGDPSLERLSRLGAVESLDALVTVAALVVWVGIVRWITARQEEARVGAASAPGVPPAW
ncbi:uncharacterized protein DUF4328 [Kineococcus xinjiangensis]|uniref:Uncharacterized protein DUF4328 n=1 Tax=Kineococcus xinjiangensis TaxID=512762 RepID=A0A2S6IMJ7_9ACTN|nr:DUF4328 domain-containing protein [Kineococcus xinjiangensis]PPK95376.1 uncharacterized protein DUF4328 [Kineococcus xinjiangensis]